MAESRSMNDHDFADDPARIGEGFAIMAAIRKGEDAADAGLVTPHEEVRRKLTSWIARAFEREARE